MRSLLERDRVLGAVGLLAVLGIALLTAWLVARTPGQATGKLAVAGAPTGVTGVTVSYTLAPGRSASDVASDLESLGVIRSARQFRILAALMGLEETLSAGDHMLPKGASTATILNLVTVKKGVPTIRVTFPEGIRIEEMAAIAEEAGFGSAVDFVAAAREAALPADFAAGLPPGHDRQGYLFPDTYILPVGSNMTDLVQYMLETLDERFRKELRDAVTAQGLTLHQALTLASIVEREAVLAEERPLIAGVFMNRIGAGERLDADPTVQFVVALNPANVRQFGWWKKEITAADLDIDSPYNTRKFGGIPPGPITNPGLASIEAVARPTPTRMFFFVADAKKGDGSHVFAETLEEHLRNIDRFGP